MSPKKSSNTSSKTPKASAKKTASGLSRLLVGGALLAAAVAGPAWYFGRHANQLIIKGRVYSLEIAATAGARTLGLGGRRSLPADRAMLFVFDQPGIHCFWMKDTLIPLDIVWFGADRRVVDVKRDVRPESYPEVFCPKQPAKYVVEFVAGTAATTGLTVGDYATF